MQILEPLTLPDAAIRRLRAIRQRAEAERAVRGALTDQYRAAVEREQMAREQLARHRQWMGHNPADPNDVRLVRLAEEAAASAAELKRRLGELRTSGFPGRVEQFVKRLSGGGIPLRAHVTRFTPRRGEAATDAVSRLRNELAQLRADLHQVKSAPITSAEACAIIRDSVDFLASHGSVGVLSTIHAGNPPTWPDAAVRNNMIHHGAFSLPGIFAFVAWACRDQIVAKLESEISALADDGVALDRETRAFRVGELTAKILETERLECAAVEAAENAGAVIDYRDDCAIIAALNLADSVEV